MDKQFILNISLFYCFKSNKVIVERFKRGKICVSNGKILVNIIIDILRHCI